MATCWKRTATYDPAGGDSSDGERDSSADRFTIAGWSLRRRIPGIGFTMIEMLIALAIVGTLLAIALPVIQNALDQARIARAIGDIGAIQTDIAGYEAGGNGLPESLADIGRGDMEDPWGNPYRYLNFHIDPTKVGKKGGGPPAGARKDRFLVPINSTYDLYSTGKDGKTVAALTATNSKDDVIRANDGGFVGLAVKY
jgi:general secretion pathway protein G